MRVNVIAKITQKVQKECLAKKSTTFETEIDGKSLVDQFECVVNVIGKVSKRKGLGDLWSQYEPQFKEVIDTWKQCSGTDDKLQVIL